MQGQWMRGEPETECATCGWGGGRLWHLRVSLDGPDPHPLLTGSPGLALGPSSSLSEKPISHCKPPAWLWDRLPQGVSVQAPLPGWTAGLCQAKAQEGPGAWVNRLAAQPPGLGRTFLAVGYPERPCPQLLCM